MRSDGSIVFNTEIDNSDVEKDLNEAKRKIEKANKEIADAEDAKLPLVEEAKKLGAELDNAKAKLAALQKQQASASSALSGANPVAYSEAFAKKAQIDTEAASQQKEVDKLQRKWDGVNDKVDRYNAKINRAQTSLTEQTAKAGQLSAQLAKGSNGMSDALAAAHASAKKLEKRIISLASRVLVFSVLATALRTVRDYMGKMLESNEEYTTQLAKLKGALLTAFQPIYEVLVPALISLMKIATSVVQAIARVAAFLGGKSVSEYAASAKAIYEEANAIKETGKAAKEAQKSLAGFDEINKLSGNSKENSGSESATTTPNFSDFSTEEYAQKLDELTLILSGALLALGAILAFSGANIPLGIGLMAFGAVGLAAEAAMNWGAIVEALQGPIGEIITIMSSALLVLGAILAFTGAALPLGIGLMVAGALGLASTIAANWSAVEGPLSTALSSIMVILGGAMLVIGVIMCLTGAGLGVGLALILTGLAGTITAVNASDNPLTRFVKGLVNGIIGLINLIIDAINALFHIKFDGLKIGGVQLIPKIDFHLLKLPKIPLLAQGGVIPPNREFLAVLGDQKHGTNIEAPLATIQEAVALVMEDMTGGMMAGFEATVAVLKEILEAVYGIEVGDDVIGRAVARYNAKMAIARGGV